MHHKNCKNYILIKNFASRQINKIPNEYILSSIYTLKIDFKFPSAKVEKLKVDKQKGTEGIYYSLLFFLEILRKLYMSSSSYPIHPVYIEKLCSGSGERRKTTTYTIKESAVKEFLPQLKKESSMRVKPAIILL